MMKWNRQRRSKHGRWIFAAFNLTAAIKIAVVTDTVIVAFITVIILFMIIVIVGCVAAIAIILLITVVSVDADDGLRSR